MTETITEGLVAFVKKDCPTCVLVEPVLGRLAGEGLTIVTQDDPAFPDLDGVVHDDTLEMSWRADVETVPTLVRMAGGSEAGRIVGWSRPEWEAFTGVTGLGHDLPEHRPGCGSMSVDPQFADALEARFGDGLSARRVEFAALEDPIEAMYERGWSDGLPLVPPTPERVLRMLAGTTREPAEVVAVIPPVLVEATVEKVAVNAVMAGCAPEYLPVVLAAVEAVCTDEFNMHGVLATTMGVGPVFMVNGPIRKRIGMESGMNVLGQGNRANATIGRAVQLLVRNVGGGRPGEIDRATHGNPGKLGFCFAEDEEGSPWEPFSTTRGFETGIDTVTAFCGEGPRIIFDQPSRTPEALTRSIASVMRSSVHPKITGLDTMLVLCPEHMARFVDAGWSRARFMAELEALLEVEVDSILQGVDGIDEGIPAGLGLEGHKLPKHREILVVHAGGPAGLFSSVIGGWMSGPMGSIPVTKEITP
ncbi:MAG: thioredoxin family protein [Acidimicrobiales bacterium]